MQGLLGHARDLGLYFKSNKKLLKSLRRKDDLDCESVINWRRVRMNVGRSVRRLLQKARQRENGDLD